MLKNALINQARKDTYGEKEIANTGKILRNLWEAIGQEDFEDWIRRAFILVQSEAFLLSVLFQPQPHETTEDGEDIQTTGEENSSKVALSDLWENREKSRSSQGQKPNEQLRRQLNQTLLELSCQTAPAEILMRCLRIADERAWSMLTTLATDAQGRARGQGTAGDAENSVGSAICYNGENLTSPINKQNPRPGDPCHTLGTDARNYVCFEPRSQDGHARISADGLSPTINTAQGGQRQPCVVMAQGSANAEIGVDYCPTLTAHHEQPLLARALKAKANLSFREDSDTIIAKHNTVRRLTPLECCRLQGYPDNWCHIPGASDSAEYKAYGNSFAIPCAYFVISGCVQAIADLERG